MGLRFDDHDVHLIERGPGDGDVVVLHHGLLASASGWDAVGFVDALAQRHRVWAVDSFGHGGTDDARDSSLNGRDARADLVAAVADHHGVERFHYVGYSMGAWVGGALARRHPDRLQSLSLAAYDVEQGMPTVVAWAQATFGVELTFEVLLGLGQATFPDVAAASPRRVEGWRTTFDLMAEHRPRDAEVLAALDVPVHLWCGRDDGYHDAMAGVAERIGARFDTIAGDHMSAVFDPEAPAVVVAHLSSCA